MSRRRGVSSGPVLALLLGTLIAGCGVTPPHRPAPTTPAPSVPTPAPATPSSTPEPPDLSAATEFTATGQVPLILDAGLIAEALHGVESRSDAARHVFASWPQFGLPNADAEINGYYTAAIGAFDAAHPDADDEDPAPELNLGWHLVASSPQAVAIVADGYEFSGGTTRERWRSLWFDPAADRPLTAADLADPATTDQALSSVAAALDVPGLDLATTGPSPLAAATLVAFAADGALLVGYDACQVAACPAGRVTLTIPVTTTDGLLTAAGQAARAATLSPLSPSAPAQPGPEPTPSETAGPTPSSSPIPPPGEVDCREARCVALTFDDGPGPFTTRLLAHLKEAAVPATFFLLGQQVETYPEVTRALADAGHELGVHTWDHRMLTRLTDEQVHDEIASSIRIVKQVTGHRPRLMRPPYGETNAAVAAQARKAKVAQILWNVDTLDWRTRSTEKTVAAALKQTRRGSILLLHDIHKTTVAAVPGIIQGLREKGYTFVTVGQLLGRTKPGRIYSHG